MTSADAYSEGGEKRPLVAHGFRSPNGRLSPLTAPTGMIGKVCNGSNRRVRGSARERPVMAQSLRQPQWGL